MGEGQLGQQLDICSSGVQGFTWITLRTFCKKDVHLLYYTLLCIPLYFPPLSSNH